jgi:hypothetical protein
VKWRSTSWVFLDISTCVVLLKMSNVEGGIALEDIPGTLKSLISWSVFQTTQCSRGINPRIKNRIAFFDAYFYDSGLLDDYGAICFEGGRYCIEFVFDIDKEKNLSRFSIKFGTMEAAFFGRSLYRIDASPDQTTSSDIPIPDGFIQDVKSNFIIRSQGRPQKIRDLGIEIINHPLFSNVYIFMKLLGIAVALRSKFEGKSWGSWNFSKMDGTRVILEVRKSYMSMRKHIVFLDNLYSADYFVIIRIDGIGESVIRDIRDFPEQLNSMLKSRLLHVMHSMLTSLDMICNKLTLN